MSGTVSYAKSCGVHSFADFDKINNIDEIKSLLVDKNLGIIIGKGQKFSDKEIAMICELLGRDVSEKEVLLLIDTWLNEKIKEFEVDIMTNGADYNKKKADGSFVESAMFEMTCNLDCEVIGVTHPDNIGANNKILGRNTKWLTKSKGDGWGGYDVDVSKPTGATRTTVEFMSGAKDVKLFVVSGGNTTAKELKVYKNLGVDIIMLNLSLDSPGEKVAYELGIEMDNLEDI